MITINFSEKCTYRYFPETRYCETIINGIKIPASPQEDNSYLDRANYLGYKGDVLAMCREHEMFHSFLAVAAGLPYSPTLFDVSNNFTTGDHLRRCDEESIVLNFQQVMNGAATPSKELREFCDTNGIVLTNLIDKATKYRKMLEDAKV